MTMVILLESFLLLSCLGLWRPTNWSGWKSNIYKLYSILIILLCYGFLFSFILDLLIVSKTMDEIIENILVLFPMIVTCTKIIGIIGWRKEILQIINCFQTAGLKPRTVDEVNIQKQYDRTIR